MTHSRKTITAIHTHSRHSREGGNPYKFPPTTFCLALFITLAIVILWPIRLISKEGIQPTLSLVILASLLFVTAHLFRKHKKKVLGIICVGILTLIFSGALTHNSLAGFIGENKEKIVLECPLYPTVFTGRVYLNKFSLFTQKYQDNFFSLLDPNRYLFGAHPREGQVYGQNYIKLPLSALIAIVFGLSAYPVFSIIAVFISLSFSRNIGNLDFFAFPFFVSLIYLGVEKIIKHKSSVLKTLFFLIFLLSFIEFFL